jgi:hypothetical protein
MYTERNRQLDVGGSAGTRDEYKIAIAFCLCENLMHVGPNHAWADYCQVNTRQ